MLNIHCFNDLLAYIEANVMGQPKTIQVEVDNTKQTLLLRCLLYCIQLIEQLPAWCWLLEVVCAQQCPVDVLDMHQLMCAVKSRLLIVLRAGVWRAGEHGLRQGVHAGARPWQA